MEEKKKKILVIEDEKPLSSSLKLKLMHEGFFVEEASNGEEGLNLIDKEKFDLILLDIVMGTLDGFGVLARLKERKSKIPVIVMSNLTQPEDVHKARDLGAKEYVAKADTSISGIVNLVKQYA